MSDLIHSACRLTAGLLLLTGLVACGAKASSASAADEPANPPAEVPASAREAVLGAGCFWCVEVFYERLDGVYEVVSGYAGGTEPDPNYESVSRGATSHAEVVKIYYDPEAISYRELVDFFWKTHDPTRADGVWPDFGQQYRSILLYQSEAEKSAIEASRRAYEERTGTQIATEIAPLERFYPAEKYHQDFAEINPRNRYVQNILNPKLEKLGFEPVD